MSLVVYVPQVGQANSTEEPKLTNSMVNLSAWANGNVDDADLRSPNNSVRRLLLQATGVIDNEVTVGDRDEPGRAALRVQPRVVAAEVADADDTDRNPLVAHRITPRFEPRTNSRK